MIKKITFTHTNGKQYTFDTKQNKLTGDQMYTFDGWKNCYASDLKTVKGIISRLPKK